MADSSRDGGIDKFLDEKPQDNNDSGKDLPRRKLGLPQFIKLSR